MKFDNIESIDIDTQENNFKENLLQEQQDANSELMTEVDRTEFNSEQNFIHDNIPDQNHKAYWDHLLQSQHLESNRREEQHFSSQANTNTGDQSVSNGSHSNTYSTQGFPEKKIIGGGKIEHEPTKICVMGVGGGGVNAVNLMAAGKITGVDIVAANTDSQTLSNAHPSIMLLPLGKNMRGGLGAGGNPTRGAEAAQEAREDIFEFIQQYDMLFLAAGLGGGTGTGATPIIAEVAKEAGVLTLAVVTLPFDFEGEQRVNIAEYGLEDLESVVDAIVVIPNDNINRSEYTAHNDSGVLDGFEIVDSVLANTVRSLTEIITIPSRINVDFADIKECLTNAGRIAVAFGSADSEERKNGNAHRAIDSAVKQTVIAKENLDILTSANHIIVNTVAGSEVSMGDYNAISDIITKRINQVEDRAFKHGYRVNSEWKKKVQVTIIASNKSDVAYRERQERLSTIRSTKKPEKAPLDNKFGGNSRDSKEIFKINTDYVKHDVFEKLLEKSSSTTHENLTGSEHGTSPLNDNYNVPAVNRLLSLAGEESPTSEKHEVAHKIPAYASTDDFDESEYLKKTRPNLVDSLLDNSPHGLY